MNDFAAANIKQLREEKPWTQEQLAQAAALATRTVQRAEEGQGLSAETLLAIAGALDVAVESLRADPLQPLVDSFGVPREELTEEFIARKLEEAESEAKAKYMVVAVREVSDVTDLGAVFGGEALHFTCTSTNAQVRDIAARLEAYLTDTLDVDEPIIRRDCEKEVLEIVQELNALGVVVSVGLHRHAILQGDRPPLAFSTLFAIAWPADQKKQKLLVPKGPVQFR
jgi:transcriptional regulator with XRE-family HTH domain